MPASKSKPLPLTEAEIAQHRKAQIEYARWCGEHKREVTFHSLEMRDAYEAAEVLS